MSIDLEKRDRETPEDASQLSQDDDIETVNGVPDKAEGATRNSSSHIDDGVACELGDGIRPGSQISRHSSARARNPSIVPRLKRRGLLATWTIIPEVERPLEYSNQVKWIITSFTAIAGAAAPMGSAIFYR